MQCGQNMDLDESSGTCACRDGMMFNSDESDCYDGVDINFDMTKLT